MSRSRETTAEALAAVVVGGVLHQVPVSRVEIEQEIDRATKAQGEIDELESMRDRRGTDIVRLIETHQGEIRKLQEQLDLERGPLQSQIATKQQTLNLSLARLWELIEPRMGEQKSMKVSGLAGTVEASRTPKMDVPTQSIPLLRKLLGDQFPTAFETKETAKALSGAWTLLKTWKGAKLIKLRSLVTVNETAGRVRLVDPK